MDRVLLPRVILIVVAAACGRRLSPRGSSGDGQGFPADVVPSARDGDSDGGCASGKFLAASLSAASIAPHVLYSLEPFLEGRMRRRAKA